MNPNGIYFNINSTHPQRLLAFYRDVVGLPPEPGMEDFSLTAAGVTLGFDEHRDLTGPTKEPSRFLIDFWVSDLAREQKRMEAAGAKFIRTAGHEEWGGVISTFVDPDGNYGQVIQVPGGETPPGQVSGFFLDVTSDDKDRMLAFYRDVVGLAPFEMAGPWALTMREGAFIHFDTHSDTHGPSKEPARILLNFMIDDIAAEEARLEKAGARFFRRQGVEAWGGVISSFLDPDGNILQLIQYRPELATTSAQG
jgi:predicted enzyme related to lactoylglutathione lyase